MPGVSQVVPIGGEVKQYQVLVSPERMGARDVSLKEVVAAAEIAGLRAMLVHAKDDSAKRFYEKFGFEPSPIDAFHLFLKLSDILSSLR